MKPFINPKRPTKRIAIAVAIAALVTVSVTAVQLNRSEPPRTTAHAPAPTEVQVMAFPRDGTPEQSGTAPAVPTIAEKDRYTLVEGLMKSRDPKDAWKAAQIIAPCLRAKNIETARAQETDPFTKQVNATIPKAEETCPGLSPGQIAALPRLVAEAATAGIEPAYNLAYSLSGDYPELSASEWDKVQEAAANAGVTAAASNRSGIIRDKCLNPAAKCTEADWAVALKYTVEAEELRKARKTGLGISTPRPTLIVKAGPLADQAVREGEALAAAAIARDSGRTQ
jgi:hypothetical protein